MRATIDITGIDWTAPATEVSDEVLARVQAARPDLDWDAQFDLHEAIVLPRLR